MFLPVLALRDFLLLCLSQVSSIKVSTPAEVHASKGDTVQLKCTFTSTSPPNSKMSVHWSYKPRTGAVDTIHYTSLVLMLCRFKVQVLHEGRPARGVASITLINATLHDNGTYTCDVSNPPDVYGSPNSHIVLTVTPKGKMRSKNG
uniref:Ig-like domain-containing protein n=1 Tax=Fundulus heteroclitus TaxID=8078 RepID=A0A3Q2UJ24_FUNHE